MQTNTKKENRKVAAPLSPSAVAMIRRTHGLAAKIAAAAGMDRSYVAHVLAGRRRPSAKLRHAIEKVLLAAVSKMEIEAVRLTLPGVSSCGPRELGAR